MKKLFKRAFNIGLIGSVLLLSSCEAEKDLMKKKSYIEKSNSEISFSQFKKETGLSNFKSTLKINNPNNALSRNADGSYDLTDFDIDTEIVKRLQLEENVTYSFRVYPKLVVSPDSFYNLTMDYKNGEWIQNVIEFKPTLENFDNL
ncbi:MAG TPA: hypothetical protein PLP39_01720 [Flavobacterium lutivivi]|nr:hypothetical protein [Flavobacterium lutivivi]